jgi:hypothetical protein
MSDSAYRLLRPPTDSTIPHTGRDKDAGQTTRKNKTHGEEGKIGPISPVLDDELEAALGEVGQADMLVSHLTTRLLGHQCPVQTRQQGPWPTRLNLLKNVPRPIHRKHQSVLSLWLIGQ